MYLLFIFTMVVPNGNFDWRHQGEFNTETKCIQAAKRMQIPENKYICTAK